MTQKISRAELAKLANEWAKGMAPELKTNSSRETLIAWLTFARPMWHHADKLREKRGLNPYGLTEAWREVFHVITEPA